jgi:hypothetical protein
MIDWEKPLQLSDGTPVKLRRKGFYNANYAVLSYKSRSEEIFILVSTDQRNGVYPVYDNINTPTNCGHTLFVMNAPEKPLEITLARYKAPNSEPGPWFDVTSPYRDPNMAQFHEIKRFREIKD